MYFKAVSILFETLPAFPNLYYGGPYIKALDNKIIRQKAFNFVDSLESTDDIKIFSRETGSAKVFMHKSFIGTVSSRTSCREILYKNISSRPFGRSCFNASENLVGVRYNRCAKAVMTNSAERFLNKMVKQFGQGYAYKGKKSMGVYLKVEHRDIISEKYGMFLNMLMSIMRSYNSIIPKKNYGHLDWPDTASELFSIIKESEKYDWRFLLTFSLLKNRCEIIFDKNSWRNCNGPKTFITNNELKIIRNLPYVGVTRKRAIKNDLFGIQLPKEISKCLSV